MLPWHYQLLCNWGSLKAEVIGGGGSGWGEELLFSNFWWRGLTPRTIPPVVSAQLLLMALHVYPVDQLSYDTQISAQIYFEIHYKARRSFSVGCNDTGVSLFIVLHLFELPSFYDHLKVLGIGDSSGFFFQTLYC